jgi:plasmid stabilization system protein ParE
LSLRLRVTARATRDIERADAWWQENRLAAPRALRDDLKAAFDLLSQQPAVGLRVANARVSGVRRLHLGRVRYFIYYRATADELVVLSVWHMSRAQGPHV